MKAEYIPGDLVMTNTKSNSQIPKGLVCEFVGYDLSRNNKVFVKYEGTNETFWLEDGEIAPIKLVPKILEKNGWREHKGDYIDDSHHLMLCEKYEGYVLYKVINEKVVWLMDIDYVHTLQHLLFGLGLDSNMIV